MISTLVSLVGTIRSFNPIDPVVGDSVVRSIVTDLARRDDGYFVVEQASSEMRFERIMEADSFLSDVDDAAASTARTLNGRDVSPDKHEQWTQESILSHIDRVGVFA